MEKKQKYSFKENVVDAYRAIAQIPYFSHLMRENISINVWEDNNKIMGRSGTDSVVGLVYKRTKKNNAICFCEALISSKQKISVAEIAFINLVVCIFNGFGLYKNYEKQSDKEKKANFIYAFSYVYNVMGFQEVPPAWANLKNIISEVNTKNKESVLSDFEYKAGLFEKFINFGFTNNNQNNAIVFSDEVTYSHIDFSFEDAFAKGIIDNAAQVLKTTNSSKEIKNHPVQEWFFRNYPFFSSLSAMFKIETDKDVCRARGIFYGAVDVSSKTIYLNEFNIPSLSSEPSQKQIFVMAHEMLHVALNHIGRRKNREFLMWNLACDFVINNWLVEMAVGVPPDGIYIDKSLARLSAEEIYEIIKEDRDILKRMSTMASCDAGHKYGKHKNKNAHVDMFGEDSSQKQFGDVQDAAAEALLQGYNVHCNLGRGLLPAGLEEEIRILQQPVIPWRVELANWFARNFPEDEKKRTYAKASRRQSATPDIPRATYYRPTKDSRTKTFGVILDTSGSMDNVLLGKSLGIIAAYAKQYDVLEVKLIYCDATPYDAGYVNVSSLKDRIKVTGRGGTVLQQAVNYLQAHKDFPQKAPILILTDGYFEESLEVKNPHAFVVPDKRIIRGRKDVFEFN